MRNKITKHLLFVVFMITLCTSCRYETIVTSPDNENSIIDDNSVVAGLIRDITLNDGSNDNIVDFANCFSLKLPTTVFANGIEVMIDANEDYDVVRAIFDQSTVDTDVIEFNFPITVILADYSEEILSNQNEFDALSSTCNGENEDDSDIECIDFLYPVSFSVYSTITEQTSEVDINNDNELFNFIKDLSVDDVASLNFPVTLILSDDTRETVNSLSELEILVDSVKDSCDEDDDFNYFDNDFDDTQNPSTPTNLIATNITENSVDLSWNVSTDNIGVSNYGVYINGIFNTSTSANSITINNLDPATSYTFTVNARDASGNASVESNSVIITTLASSDTTAPFSPTNLIASNITQTMVTLQWDAATDNIGVIAYDVYRDGILLDTTDELIFEVSSLTPNTSYSFNVIAIDAAGNNSASSNVVAITTLASAGDTEAPSVPLNLVANNTTSSSTELSWDASTDNVGVEGYDVYINGAFFKYVTTTFCDVKGLESDTEYAFAVLAKDAENNASSLSASIIERTLPASQVLAIEDVLTTCSNWTIQRFEDDDDDETNEVSNFIFNFMNDGTLIMENTLSGQTFSGTWEIISNSQGRVMFRMTIPGLADDNMERFNASWSVTIVVRADGATTIELNSGEKILIFTTRSCP